MDTGGNRDAIITCKINLLCKYSTDGTRGRGGAKFRLG